MYFKSQKRHAYKLYKTIVKELKETEDGLYKAYMCLETFNHFKVRNFDLLKLEIKITKVIIEGKQNEILFTSDNECFAYNYILTDIQEDFDDILNREQEDDLTVYLRFLNGKRKYLRIEAATLQTTFLGENSNENTPETIHQLINPPEYLNITQ